MKTGPITSEYSNLDSDPVNFWHSKYLKTNSNEIINWLQMARTRANLYALSKYMRMNTMTQKYALRASHTKSGEKTIHQVRDLSPKSVSTFKVNKTVNMVKQTNAVQISKTVMPSQRKSSLSEKNIYTDFNVLAQNTFKIRKTQISSDFLDFSLF